MPLLRTAPCYATRPALCLVVLLCLTAMYNIRAAPSITYSAHLVDLTTLPSGASALCRSSPAMKSWGGKVQLAVTDIRATGWGTEGSVTHLTSIKSDGGCADGAADGNGALLVPQGCADACTNSSFCHNIQAVSWNRCPPKYQRTRTEVAYSYSNRKLYVSFNGSPPVVTDWPEDNQGPGDTVNTISAAADGVIPWSVNLTVSEDKKIITTKTFEWCVGDKCKADSTWTTCDTTVVLDAEATTIKEFSLGSGGTLGVITSGSFIRDIDPPMVIVRRHGASSGSPGAAALVNRINNVVLGSYQQVQDVLLSYEVTSATTTTPRQTINTTAVLSTASGQKVSTVTHSLGEVDPKGSKGATLGVSIPCSAPAAPGASVDVTVAVGRDACGAAWPDQTFSNVGGPFAITASNSMALQAVALSVSPSGDLLPTTCFNGDFTGKPPYTRPGTILFGHIVTFGSACGPRKPGFRSDANSVLTLPEGFDFLKTDQSYIGLWAKDEINSSVALNFQDPSLHFGPETAYGVNFTEVACQPREMNVLWPNLEAGHSMNVKTKIYLRAKVRYTGTTPPQQDRRFTLNSSAYASDESGNVDSQASASGSQTIAYRGSQCTDFAAIRR